MIIGAGLTGLIAGHAFPKRQLIEAAKQPEKLHNAVLRFRSPLIGELTGIPFRPVTVRKGIWFKGGWNEPSINLANEYSRKVIGRTVDRSIWNIDAVTRWIAPGNLYERLVENVKGRIDWGTRYDFADDGKDNSATVINTSPLDKVVAQLVAADKWVCALDFAYAPIKVLKFRIKDCDVHQTVYFPTPLHSLYRASITGDLMICEFAGDAFANSGDWKKELVEAFWVRDMDSVGDVAEQKYGKIADVDTQARRLLLAGLTQNRRVYSLGRFGTWRNILLDDLLKDINIIKQLMEESEYRTSIRRSAWTMSK